MNTVRRWLTIMLTCRLGFHLPMPERMITEGTKLRECPRCHWTIVATKHSTWREFNKPLAWDVAKGLYDRPQDQWGGD